MASLTRWTWVWVHSRSWWWTWRPGVLWFMGSQRVGNDWATELNWLNWSINYPIQQQIWRWMAKDSFSNSIMLPRVLQALSTHSSTIFSTLVSSLWLTPHGFKMAAISPGIMPTSGHLSGKQGTNSHFLLRLWLKNFLTTSLGRSLHYFCSS